MSEADAAAAKAKLENGVKTHWSGKFTLEADDPECGKKSFPIEYKIVYAHEFAHCVGLPDEYSYSTDMDAAVSAPPDGKAKTAPDATIMSAVDNTTTLSRHAWNIAIEVQEMLKTGLGRAVKCSIN